MRSRLLALRTTGAAAALVVVPVLGATVLGATVLGATAAQADESVRVTVTPATVAPGGEVAIRVDGCKSRFGTARSQVFVLEAGLSGPLFGRGGRDEGPPPREEGAYGSEEAGREDGRKSPLFGQAAIKSEAASGTYEVKVKCDGHGRSGAGIVQVVHSRPTHHRPTHHASPVAPVRAGGGGTAVLAADGRDSGKADGPGTRHAVIGLVLAGVAAVAVAYRSVRRQRSAARDAD
ncbi:hypothetical protein OG349_23515 [Streptomyces sp. NBC_01317]|uniref:hypothetical protein n=1 Tax=Streptomyces sp. NBC_01317 TaxID=2903822 RepID=UPI002E0E3341|nr:hypothetical protein OG349_23515 [Streptomyces sp. NBC_01317]